LKTNKTDPERPPASKENHPDPTILRKPQENPNHPFQHPPKTTKKSKSKPSNHPPKTANPNTRKTSRFENPNPLNEPTKKVGEEPVEPEMLNLISH
jgi:hypothetical protein